MNQYLKVCLNTNKQNTIQSNSLHSIFPRSESNVSDITTYSFILNGFF